MKWQNRLLLPLTIQDKTMIGQMAGLATALLWSWTALIFASASRRVGSFQVNIIRLLFGTTFLLSAGFITHGHFKADLNSILFLSASGFVGLVFGDGALFKSLELIGARLSMLVMAIVPVLTAIGAFFILGEVPTSAGFIGILLTVGGIYYVLLGKGEQAAFEPRHYRRGIFLAFLGAVGQAGGLIIAKYGFVSAELDALTATSIRLITGLSGMLLYALFSGRMQRVGQVIRDGKALPLIITGSVFGPFLGIWMSMISIKYSQTGISAALMATTPVMIIPFSILFLKEKITLRTITGSLITIGGVFLIFSA